MLGNESLLSADSDQGKEVLSSLSAIAAGLKDDGSTAASKRLPKGGST